MKPLTNIEIKASCCNKDHIRKILNNKKARFIGNDRQVDTYFNVRSGRLKLREGNIENNLIHYERKNQAGPKEARVMLYQSKPESTLKEILIKSLGVLCVVDKMREIYFIDNVKFHIDEVKELGEFVEIEAIDKEGTIGKAKLLEQCRHYLSLFDIEENNLISNSYSDLILNKK